MPGAYPLQLGAVRALDAAREKDLAKSRRAAEAQRQWRGEMTRMHNRSSAAARAQLPCLGGRQRLTTGCYSEEYLITHRRAEQSLHIN
jgi:hypothetical protein